MILVINVFYFPVLPTDRGQVRRFTPLRPMKANLDYRHPGAPDSAVGFIHQRDHDPTIDVSTHTGLGMLPPGSEATGKKF